MIEPQCTKELKLKLKKKALTRVSWATNNGRENCAWGVITSETGLAHTGSVIHDESLNVLFSHFISFERNLFHFLVSWGGAPERFEKK